MHRFLSRGKKSPFHSCFPLRFLFLQSLPALWSPSCPHFSLDLAASRLLIPTLFLCIYVCVSISLSPSIHRSLSSFFLFIHLHSLLPSTSSSSHVPRPFYPPNQGHISFSFLPVLPVQHHFSPHFSLPEIHRILFPPQPTPLNIPDFHYLLTS